MIFAGIAMVALGLLIAWAVFCFLCYDADR